MKALIVSDVHSNLEAFSSVIGDAGRQTGFDQIWSLGDLVGYGPDPAAVIDLIREHDHRAVAGNHDLASIGKLSLEAFNEHAAAANSWTARVLDQDRMQFLSEQPLSLEIDEFTIVHGSPRDPIWNTWSLSGPPCLLQPLRHLLVPCRTLPRPVHLPHVGRHKGRALLLAGLWDTYPLDEQRLIVNPGGVGQPRDGIPGRLMLYTTQTTESVTHFRVEYDIPTTQLKMRSHGLPQFS